MKTKLKLDLFLKLFYLSLGFGIISYVIYVRVFLTRVPKSLEMFNPNNYKLILLVISGILLSLFLIIINIKTLYKKKDAVNILQRFLLKINNVIIESLTTIYALIIYNIKDNFDKISLVAKKFYDLFGTTHEGLFLFILYFIRSIILIFFLIDVFYFYELKYFYKSLILLSISLCIKVLFFILKDFAKNLEYTESFLEIEQHISSSDSETTNPSITFKPSEGNEDIDLQYHINQFTICSKISGYLEGYDFFTNYYNSKMNIILYSFYLIGWLYILITNIL